MNAPANVAIIAPFSTVHIPGEDVNDHAIMRARQLAQLLLLIQPEDGPDTMLWLAQQMAHEVVGALAGMMGVQP
jgi:hypothetical protein